MKAAEKSLLTRVVTPALAVAILAVSGAAYAGPGTSGPAADKGQVDCKKTPNDPACTKKPK